MKRTLGQHQSDRQHAEPSAFSAWRAATPALQPTYDRVPAPDESEEPQEAMPFPGPYAYTPALLPAQDSIANAAMTVQTGMVRRPLAPAFHAMDGEGEKNLDALILSIKANDHEALADVLKQGDVDVNGFDLITGLPPLALAACNGAARAVALLLANGADVNLPGKHRGWTALMHAARHGHTGIIEILTACGSIALDMGNSDGRTAIHLAAQYGQPGAVASLLAKGAMVSVVDKVGISPLMVAAHNGDIAVTELLVACDKIDLDNAVMKDGKTALHIAAFSDNPEVASCLLAAGANPNALDVFGETPLLCAVAENSVGVTRLLAATAGIQLDTVALNGMTALWAAISNDRPELARFLLAAGARLDLCNGHGMLPLSAALGRRSAAMVEALLEHGATLQDFNCTGDDTPFTIAVADLQNMRDAREIEQHAFFVQDKVRPVGVPPILANMLAVLDKQSDLVRWLRSQRIMLPCVHTMAECLASYGKIVNALEQGRRPLGNIQKLWLCISALTMMSQDRGREIALQVYRQAGISEAGLARLAEATHRQFECLNTLVEQVMTGLGASMLESMVPDCLALTSRSYDIDSLALESRQTDAGFLPPLAQAIVRSWQRALTGIEKMPVVVPDLANHKQLTQALDDLAERATPALFVKALRAELSSQALLEGLRHFIGDMENAELIDVLFQIQCDQLCQYCRQMAGAD